MGENGWGWRQRSTEQQGLSAEQREVPHPEELKPVYEHGGSSHNGDGDPRTQGKYLFSTVWLNLVQQQMEKYLLMLRTTASVSWEQVYNTVEESCERLPYSSCPYQK